MNLNETWKQCIKMWRWIDKQRKDDPLLCVEQLKVDWMLENVGNTHSVLSLCFFCAHDNDMRRRLMKSCTETCDYCPMRMYVHVDEWKTYYCVSSEHHYSAKPRKFYNLMRRLNTKRNKRMKK